MRQAWSMRQQQMRAQVCRGHRWKTPRTHDKLPPKRWYEVASSQYAAALEPAYGPVETQRLRMRAVAAARGLEREWWDEPACSISGSRPVLPAEGGSTVETRDAFGEANGLATHASYETARALCASARKAGAAMAARVEAGTLDDVTQAVRRVEAELFDPEGAFAPELIANQARDFHKQDGVTEIEEALQASAVERRLNDGLLADERAGRAVVDRSPAVALCVANFSNFLDLSRKVLRNLEAGVPVVVLGRPQSSGQHVYRWARMLSERLAADEATAKSGAADLFHFACVDLPNQRRLLLEVLDDCPAYLTGSRQAAAAVKELTRRTFASCGGPNTMILCADRALDVGSFAAAVRDSAFIEQSGQCTALRHVVAPGAHDLAPADIERSLLAPAGGGCAQTVLCVSAVDALESGRFSALLPEAPTLSASSSSTSSESADSLAQSLADQLRAQGYSVAGDAKPSTGHPGRKLPTARSSAESTKNTRAAADRIAAPAIESPPSTGAPAASNEASNTAALDKAVPGYTLALRDAKDRMAWRVRARSAPAPDLRLDEHWRRVVLDVTSPLSRAALLDERNEDAVAAWLLKNQPISVCVNKAAVVDHEALRFARRLWERTACVVFTVGDVSLPALTAQARPQDGEVFGEVPPRALLDTHTVAPVFVPTSTPAYAAHYAPAYLERLAAAFDENRALEEMGTKIATPPPPAVAAVVRACTSPEVKGYCLAVWNYLADATGDGPRRGVAGASRDVLWGLQRPPLGTRGATWLRLSCGVDFDAAAPTLVAFVASNAASQLRVSVHPENTQALAKLALALGDALLDSVFAKKRTDSQFENDVLLQKPWNVVRAADYAAGACATTQPGQHFGLVSHFVTRLFPFGHVKSTRPDDPAFRQAFAESPKWLSVANPYVRPPRTASAARSASL